MLTLGLLFPLHSADFLASVPESRSFILLHLVLPFCFHPSLPYLSSSCVFLDFYCHLSHLFLPPSPLSSTLPPHLFLPPAACSFQYFIYLFPEAGSLRPSLVSAATHSPAMLSTYSAPALPMGWDLPFSSTKHKQTRSTGLPSFWGGVVMATRVWLPPDTTSGWRGAESPTHPKATHPV